MITLKDLSAKCGVSIATISNVINGKKNVSEETRELVLKVVQETGYQPNFLASSLRSTKSKTVGIIIEDVTAFSSPALIEGIMESCEKQGYKCFLQNLRFYSKEIFDEGSDFKNNISQAVRQTLAIKVDGLIFLAAHSRETDVFQGELPVPAVVAYAKSENPLYPYVIINDEKAAYDMTNYIMSKGYKKIGMITGEKKSVHTIRRVKGYKKALDESEFIYDEKLVLDGKWSRQSGYELAPKLLEKGVDAVFCGNDNIAAGVIDYLREKGLVPGKDIGVAGFDGQEFSEFMFPVLTTMKLPLSEIGHRVGELIVQGINGNPFEKTEYNESCTLVKGNTI